MSKPEFANQFSLIANQYAQEAILIAKVTIPVASIKESEPVQEETIEVCKIVMTENGLRSLHSTIGNVLAQMDSKYVLPE